MVSLNSIVLQQLTSKSSYYSTENYGICLPDNTELLPYYASAYFIIHI